MKITIIFYCLLVFSTICAASDVIDDVQDLVRDLNATESCGLCPKIVGAGIWFLGASGIIPFVSNLICTGLAIGPICDIAVNSLTMLVKNAPVDEICDTFGFETCHVISRRSIDYSSVTHNYIPRSHRAFAAYNLALDENNKMIQDNPDSFFERPKMDKIPIDNMERPAGVNSLAPLNEIYQ
ncbi:unnamed protein product [Bursaphelenchus xylophilus]|uniref:(pine wood nematode) hypothetical protein n=1 Tax=Bursaphelenchus xylophilus TaxID=6326 RepID=A0A1I7RTN5_BURXY|nr:unnamed protein product [Bursaphelenchus xylophilus]CAG9122273.1 unnamed protein product [Bursaphelenchus xylophilus]